MKAKHTKAEYVVSYLTAALGMILMIIIFGPTTLTALWIFEYYLK